MGEKSLIENENLLLIVPALAFLYNPLTSRSSQTVIGVSINISKNGKSAALWIFLAISRSYNRIPALE